MGLLLAVQPVPAAKMSMPGVHVTIAVYLCVYAAAVVGVIGAILRTLRYARTPVHLRWELYPIPHEAPERAAHGGSRFESCDWWVKPQHFSRTGELRAMVPEIAWLQALREENPVLWYTSFLFHAGLYATVATVVLLLLAALVQPATSWLHAVYALTGYVAIGCTLIGAMGLLFRRWIDPAVRNYTTPADIFNLQFFIAAYGVLAGGYLVRPAGSASLGRFVRGLVTFDRSLPMGTGFAVGIMLAAVLVAYIPFTHMAHFIAKYFSYHRVRWDDGAVQRGGRIEVQVAECLQYRPTWSAAHIGGDGQKTWAELAAANPEVKK